MSDRYSLLWLFRTISLVLTLGAGMNAFGLDGASWKEEVLLHDGQKLIVERSQTYGGYLEPASREQQLVEEVWELTIPGTQQKVIWKSDWGRTNEDNLSLLVLGFLGTPPTSQLARGSAMPTTNGSALIHRASSSNLTARYGNKFRSMSFQWNSSM